MEDPEQLTSDYMKRLQVGTNFTVFYYEILKKYSITEKAILY